MGSTWSTLKQLTTKYFKHQKYFKFFKTFLD